MQETRPEPGQCQVLEPGVRRILAPNPSPMTYWGTNTYLVGAGRVAVIDPGPDRPEHLQAILRALGPGEEISHILVTHSHLDHSPLAPVLSRVSGAPVYAFGNSLAGRSSVMIALAEAGLTGGGEGVDMAFAPDEMLCDGDAIDLAGQRLEALWTPGHMANHLSFAWGDTLFTGDLIMGWASTMVSPPDGDLAAFMASTARLAARSERVFYPGHGAPIQEPQARASWLIAHRQSREAQIRAALGGEAVDIPTITTRIYTDVARALLPAAERNVFAHLIDLHTRGAVSASPALSEAADFALTHAC